MRIYRSLTIDIGTGEVLHADFYEYAGPLAEMKKGRGTQKKVEQQQLALAQKEQAERERQRGLAEPIVSEFEQEGAPGGISKYAAAQLAQNMDNIQRMYSGIRQTAYRSVGQRGFGRVPGGVERATENAANRNQALDETQAFRDALADTLGLRKAALDYRTGRQDSSGQIGQSAYSGASDAAYKRSQMGSTIGDVIGGISSLAPIIAAPFTGGTSLAGLAKGLPVGSSKGLPSEDWYKNLGSIGVTPYTTQGGLRKRTGIGSYGGG